MKQTIVCITFATLVGCSGAEDGPRPVDIQKTETVIEPSNEIIETKEVPEDLGLTEMFDGRYWVIDYISDENNIVTHKYVQPTETIDNWSEMVTVQKFKNAESEELRAYVEQLRQNIEKVVQGDFYWNIRKESETSIVYEFEIEFDPLIEEHTEVGHFFLVEDGIGAVHYAEKTTQMLGIKKQDWLEVIQETDEIMSLLDS